MRPLRDCRLDNQAKCGADASDIRMRTCLASYLGDAIKTNEEPADNSSRASSLGKQLDHRQTAQSWNLAFSAASKLFERRD